MNRVASVVINSVNHDARVLKQADSLAKAGYEVAVFGISDNRCSEAETLRESGVRIFRTEWKSSARLAAAKLYLAAAAALGVGSILLLATRLDAVHAFLISPAFALILAGGAGAWATQRLFSSYRRCRRIAESLADPDRADQAHRRGLLTAIASFVSKERRQWLDIRVRNRRIVESIQRFQPCVVHCHDIYTLPIGRACARSMGCKIVFDSHEIYEEQSLATRADRWKHRRTMRRHSRRLNGFVTVNESIAEYLKRRYPSLPNPVVIKNAARKPSHPVQYDGRLHRAADLDPNLHILLFQGGFARWRGLDALLQAAPLLPQDWRIVMMGWGRYEDHLRKLAHNVDPDGERIRFIPPAPQFELPLWTAGAALGAIPYENVCLNHWFCTPNKLWEYPVASVPVLAKPFPELRRTIEEHGIGLLLPEPASAEDIAGSVASLKPSDLEEMRRSCHSFIGCDNWSVYERRLLGLYCSVLADRRHRTIPNRTVDASALSGAPSRASSGRNCRESGEELSLI